jgi:uncharacterized membrane protein
MSDMGESSSVVPVDLVLVTGITLLVAAFVLLFDGAVPEVRTVLGFVFVLFVPGYAVTAALFPEQSEAQVATDDATEDHHPPFRGIAGLERTALSVGMSLSIVPLIGFALTFTAEGIRLIPVLGVTSGVTLFATIVAAYRRAAVPDERRFRPSFRRGLRAFGLWPPNTGSNRTTILNILLILSVLLATSSIAFSITFPKQEEQFTEFYILSEDENGTLVAQNFTSTLTNGSDSTVHVGITNREGTTTDYTVIANLQSTATESNSSRVTTQVTVGRQSVELGANESWVREFTVRPTMAGENLRLVFLLYRGDPPANPGVDNAYRTTHLWVDVDHQSGAEQPVISREHVVSDSPVSDVTRQEVQPNEVRHD